MNQRRPTRILWSTLVIGVLSTACSTRSTPRSNAGLASTPVTTAPTTTVPAVAATNSTDTALVGIDKSATVARFLDAEGREVATVPLPRPFSPIDAHGPARFIAGFDVDGTGLVIVDVAQRSTRLVDGLRPVEGKLALLNPTTVVLIAESPAGVRPIRVDLTTGTTADLIELAGSPDFAAGRDWAIMRESFGAVVIWTTGEDHSLLVPRAASVAPYFAVGRVRTVFDDTILAITTPPGNAGITQTITRGGVPIPLPAGSDEGLLLDLSSARTALRIDPAGRVGEIDLDSGEISELGTLAPGAGYVRTLGPGVATAAEDASSPQLVFGTKPFAPIVELTGHTVVTENSTSTRCTTLVDVVDTPSDAQGLVFDARSGRIVGDVGGSALTMGRDGCSVFSALTHRLVVDGSTIELGPTGWAYAVSDDGRQAVLRTGGSATPQLVDLPSTSGRPLPPADSYVFANLAA